MYQIVIRWNADQGPASGPPDDRSHAEHITIDGDHFVSHRANAEAIAEFMSTYPQVHHAEVRREDDTPVAVYVAGRLVNMLA